MKAIIEARAKINITLDILGKREDGYHDLKMILTEASLCDTITVVKRAGGRNQLGCNLSFLPIDSRNIAMLAAKAYLERIEEAFEGVLIDIHKRIPVSAGLGGGSSDAAAVLRALNDMYSGALSERELFGLAAEIGSDVPFCLTGGTALAEGRGDILTPLPPLPECCIVICKPQAGLSTRAMFERINCGRIRRRPDTKGALDALKSGDLGGLARRMYNVFEDFLAEGRRDVLEIKSIMLDEGALGAVMSGSGPSVIGLFDGADKAQGAEARLKQAYQAVFRC